MDAVQEWTAAQARVIGLVEGLGAEQAGQRVPACPNWTVHDLLAHMVGLGADVADGDEPDDHNERWTQAQVERRVDAGVPALVAEWRTVADPLRDWMRENGPRPLGDVIIHEQDLRGALGVPGAQDTAGLAGVRDMMVGRFADQVADLPPIALLGPGWQWVSRGSAQDAAVVLRAPDFELFRAVISRRSAAQLKSWTERGDVTEHLPAFASLGDLPDTDLTESTPS